MVRMLYSLSARAHYCMKLVGLIFVIVALFSSSVQTLIAGDNIAQKERILFITSYSTAHEWSREVAAGFSDYFAGVTPRVGVEVVELGILRNAGQNLPPSNSDWIYKKLETGNYKALVLADLPALEEVRENLQRLPVGIPLVFCGGIHPESVASVDYPNKIGLLRPLNSWKNIELGLSQFPGTEEILIITAAGAEGGDIHRRFAARENDAILKNVRLRMISGNDTTTADMLREIRELPQKSFVIFSNWQSAVQEDFQAFPTIVSDIIATSPGPVYATLDAYLNLGILGGVMTEGRTHGRETAELCAQVLSGIPASDISVRAGSSKLKLNWQQTMNFFISPDAYQDAEFVGKPVDWLSQNKTWLSVVLPLSVLLGSWIFFFCYNSRKMSRWRTIYEAMPLRIVVSDGKRIYFHQVEKGFPLPLSAVINDFDQIPLAQNDFFKDTIKEVLATGENCRREFNFVGRTREAIFSKLPKNIFGVETVMWISTDITELAQSREHLSEAAEYFRTTLESIGDGVIVTNAAEEVTICNPVATRLTGYAKEECVGKKLDECFNIVSYINSEKVPSPLKEALTKGVIVELANHTDLIAKDGTRRHIADSAAPIRDKEGKIVGAVLVFRDVTQEYNTRDALRMNHELMRNASKIADIEYFHYNVDNNDDLLPCRRFWDNGPDGKPLPVEDWVHPDDVALFYDAWRNLREGHSESMLVTYRVARDGDVRYYTISAQRCSSEIEAERHTSLIYGVIQDITELRRSVMEAQNSADMLHALLEKMPIPMLIKDVDNGYRYLAVNRCFEQFYGLSREQIIGKNDFELFSDQEITTGLLRDDLAAMNGDDASISERKIVDVNGKERYIMNTHGYAKLNDGSQRLIIFGIEITELKAAQHALEESNQILQAILDNVHAGVTVKDPEDDFRYITWNKWLVNKTHIPSEQMIGNTDMDSELYPEDQQDFRREDVAACEVGLVQVTSECVDSDGRKIIYDISKKHIELPSGRKLLVASMHDVTQERLMASERDGMIAQLTSYVEYERVINRCLQEITLQTDFDTSVNYLLREIGETTGADRCYVFKFEDDEKYFSNTHEWVAEGVASQSENLQGLNVNEFPGLQKILSRRQELVISDLSIPQPDGLGEEASFLRAQQIQSIILLGVWEHDQLKWLIGVDFVKTLKVFSSSDVHIVRNAANLLQLAREREHRINALADSVSLQTQIFDNISVPILLVDKEFNVIKGNPALGNGAASGERIQEMTKCYQRYCHCDAPPDDCPAKLMLASNAACTVERVIDDRNTVVNAQPIYDRFGEIVYILESGFDITQIRQQQDELDLRNCQLADSLMQEQMIGECLKVIVLNQDYESAMKEIVTYLGRQLKVDCCAIFRFDRKQKISLKESCWMSSNNEGVSELQNVIVQEDFMAGLEVLKSGKFLSADLRNPSSEPEKLELYPYLKMREMQAVFSTGIFFRGEFWGHIGIEFSDNEHKFDNIAMRLLQSSSQIIEVLLERETIYLKLLNSENEKNMIWELMTVPLVLFDANGRVIRTNPAMERLCEVSADEIVNDSALTRIYEGNSPIELMLREQKPREMEITLFGREFNIFTLPVFEQGKISRILQIFIDVTENNANKRRMQQAIEGAEEAARTKSNFLATMSHEIRTPLNAVIGFSELLQYGEIETEERDEYLRSINFAGNALLQLINDILDLSKLDSGHMEMVRESSDMYRLCTELTAIFSLRAKEKGLKLQLDCPVSLPKLEICVSRLRQVLLNLIGNAVKFTEDGGITVSLLFRKESEDSGELRIEVKDTGVGLSDEFKKKIFLPFVQQSQTRGTQEGTGLGLAISRRLIEHMGGNLTFECLAEGGTKFIVTLPHIRFRDEPPNVAPNVAVDDEQQMHRKILLVDDVPMNLKVLQTMLKRFNTEVLTAASGQEALDKLQEFSPDLILTDMWMPGMNGSELAQKIRQNPLFAKTMIFAVTADTEAKGSFSMEQFDGILLKPASIAKIQKMFNYIVGIDNTCNKEQAFII